MLVEYGGRAVLIDTTPDFREQAIRENIRHLDAVLYTHTHADHILGIDDLRPLSFLHKPNRLPLYAHPDAADFIRNMFRYIFDANYKFGGLPLVEMKPYRGPAGFVRRDVRAHHADSWRGRDLWLPVRVGCVSDRPQ